MPLSSSRSMLVLVVFIPVSTNLYEGVFLYKITSAPNINFWRNKESISGQIHTLAFWLHWIITPASPHIEATSRSKLWSPDRASAFPFYHFFILDCAVLARLWQICISWFLSDPGIPGVRSMGPVVSHWVTPTPCANYTDVTLADEYTNSILNDNANRAFQGNVAMQVTQPGEKICN